MVTPIGPISVDYDFEKAIFQIEAPLGSLGRIGIPKNGHLIVSLAEYDQECITGPIN